MHPTKVAELEDDSATTTVTHTATMTFGPARTVTVDMNITIMTFTDSMAL